MHTRQCLKQMIKQWFQRRNLSVFASLCLLWEPLDERLVKPARDVTCTSFVTNCIFDLLHLNLHADPLEVLMFSFQKSPLCTWALLTSPVSLYSQNLLCHVSPPRTSFGRSGDYFHPHSQCIEQCINRC